MSDDTPTMICPQCGAEHPDFDGFGMVSHTKLVFSDGCGFCRHMSIDLHDDGRWICNYCRREQPERGDAGKGGGE